MKTNFGGLRINTAEDKRFLDDFNRIHDVVQSPFGRMKASDLMMIIDHFLRANPTVVQKLYDQLLSSHDFSDERHALYEYLFANLVGMKEESTHCGFSSKFIDNPSEPLHLFGELSVTRDSRTGRETGCFFVDNISAPGQAQDLLPHKIGYVRNVFREVLQTEKVDIVISIDPHQQSRIQQVLENCLFNEENCLYHWDPNHHQEIGKALERYDAKIFHQTDINPDLYDSFILKPGSGYNDLSEIFEQMARVNTAFIITDKWNKHQIVGLFPVHHWTTSFLGITIFEGKVGVSNDFMDFVQPTVNEPELLEMRAFCALSEMNRRSNPYTIPFDIYRLALFDNLPQGLPRENIARVNFR